jgi:hypothetical protein
MPNIGLHRLESVISKIVLVLNSLMLGCRVHQKYKAKLFFKFLFKFVDQEVLELQCLLNDIGIFSTNCLVCLVVRLSMNLVDQ